MSGLNDFPGMERFWEQIALAELDHEQWESLCDGCGRCCLQKLEDEDTGEIYFTNIICRYYDMDNGGCSCYQQRTELVPECMVVRLANPESIEHSPATCAYRLLSEGKPLFDWHPLIAKGNEKMHQADISVRDKAVSEEYIHPDEWEDHIIDWETGGYDNQGK